MRWNVYGLDAATGQNVTLGIEEAEATAAVQTALSKRILVTHVTPEARNFLRKALFPLVCAMVVVLVPLCAMLYANNQGIEAELDRARMEPARMAESVAKAEGMLRELEKNGNLASGAAAQAKKLGEELAAARMRMSMNEQQLTMASNKLTALEQAASQVPGLQEQVTAAEKRLKTSEGVVARLNAEIGLQDKRRRELEGLLAAHQSTAVEKSNRELTAEVELLKGQLLVAAARSAPDSESSPAPEVTYSSMSRVLRPGYDASADFVRLRFDKDSLLTAARPDGLSVSSGALGANAARIQFVHDRQKERVYTATLTLPLGPDVPRDRLAMNVRLAGEFIKSFAPGIKDADAGVNSAMVELAGKESRQRIVLAGDDGKVTIWNDRTGMFTIRVEPARGDEE